MSKNAVKVQKKVDSPSKQKVVTPQQKVASPVQKRPNELVSPSGKKKQKVNNRTK
jgi:hypothetical protein